MPSIALRCSARAGSADGATSIVQVNADTEPFDLTSQWFEGRLAVRIKDFHGQAPKGKEVLRTAQSGYFDRNPKVTWSMQLQGRFLEEIDADQVVFGNLFQKPIRDYLPYGTGAALKFVRYIDPSLEQDIYADKPWAWSPLIATMNVVHLNKGPSKLPEWSPDQPTEDVSACVPNEQEAAALPGQSDARRKYFSHPDKRKAVKLGPDVVIDADFCNGFINFDTLSLKLYAGFEIPLAKYWDGQPVTFVCDGSKIFFCVEFTIVDDDIVNEKKSQGHAIETAAPTAGDNPAESANDAEDEDPAGGVD